MKKKGNKKMPKQVIHNPIPTSSRPQHIHVARHLHVKMFLASVIAKMYDGIEIFCLGVYR